jgi:hypothetical protein
MSSFRERNGSQIIPDVCSALLNASIFFCTLRADETALSSSFLFMTALRHGVRLVSACVRTELLLCAPVNQFALSHGTDK